jgi:hypothetical protein
MRTKFLILLLSLVFAGNVQAQALLSPGVPANSFTSAAIVASTNGTAFALPQGFAPTVSWQIVLTGGPSAINVVLQGSQDNISYFTIDTTTNTSGELRYLGPIALRFMRARIVSVTGGTTITVTFLVNRGFGNVVSGNVFTSPLFVPASTCAAPALGLTGNSDTGIAYTAGPGFSFCVDGTDVVTISSTGGFTSAADVQAAGDFVAINNSRLRMTTNGTAFLMTNNGSSQVQDQFTGAPACTSNCGTASSVSGTDGSFTLTMGATGVPASGFVITFNGTWVGAPQCTGSMVLAGMAVGKLPLTLVTTTTTLTVVTNGTSPSTSDKYSFLCRRGA